MQKNIKSKYICQKLYDMEYQDYYDKYFHKVEGVTAVCKHNHSFHGSKYRLTIGKTYNVRYFAMFKSCCRAVLEGDRSEYQSFCFDFYENGKPMKITEERFLSPYLRDWGIEDNIRYHQIPNCLSRIKHQYDVKILWSSLEGSRKWGYSYPKSDWDIWMLYCHSPEWYQNSPNRTDALECVYDGNIDIVGWDIVKGFQEMKSGNPIILNWLTSQSEWERDQVFMKDIEPLIPLCFDADTGIRYYYQTHIALNNKDYKNSDFQLKQFFYYLKGILFCQWIEKHRTLPPYIFNVYEDVVKNEEIMKEIKYLFYVLILRRPRCDYQVSDQLIDYAEQYAAYYKQIAMNACEFSVSEEVSQKLNTISEETIQRNANL